ncbi:Alginate biosynthesis transcriptional regulatory protein AlgB [Cesiribacter andamanensis AMV16]|uniref:Alginate biosynthesis transcriptional regulatory protein AlgB n=2 Tax=Cesiribacter TaxID=1133570 RepID=M7MWN4_9BACT|nr:Alginate biosynthesis transcriptional regulatory protein AlgB [Cesiribacter andamanensis AMV16]
MLQDRTYEVLGDSKTRTVDVRVICATNRNLEEMVARGQFREDLFYRINLITVRLPALRERPGDIPLLVNHYVRNLREIYNRPELEVAPDALRWLREQAFSGNIRELKNLVERVVLLSPHQQLGIADFQALLQPGKHQQQAMPLQAGNGSLPLMSLDEMEKAMILQAMLLHKENMSKVAKSLGLSRGALYRRLEKYNIPHEAAH